MSKTTETLRLPAMSAGTQRSLPVHRYRGGKSPLKAYIQAAIHADEVPALLVAHHLEHKLDALDARGAILGEIVLVPYANPIGLGQFLLAGHQGRFDLDSGRNFNRGYPDLTDRVVERVATQLGANAQENVRLIRSALLQELKSAQPADENAVLKLELYRLACDADIVLDLHCDFEALLHLYVGRSLWPAAADLAGALKAEVSLLADDSGGAAFDEANSSLWWRIAQKFPGKPVPPACLAATVELRGERDVEDSLAQQDANNLLRFLAGRGMLRGRRATAGKPFATSLEAVDIVTASAGGLLTWKRPLGARVKHGETLGEIVMPGESRRVPLKSRTAGLIFARRGSRWVRPGQMVAKIAGRDSLPWRQPGALLFD